MKAIKQKISGMLLSTKGRTYKTLVTSIPMVEVDAYFSAENISSELKWIIDAATNPTNVDKVKAIQNELENRVVKDGVYAPLSLTYAVEGKPILGDSSCHFPTLTFSSSSTYIVGNVLTLVAICRTLGIKTFLFSSRLSAKEINKKSLARQRLAMEGIEVRIIFDNEKGLDSNDIVNLFKKISLFDSALNLPHISERDGLLDDESFPLQPFIIQLMEETNLASFGGVNFDAKHVKVSERYVTSQYILFKLLVGAVAGVGTQEYSKMSKDLTLANGKSLTSVLSGGYMENISAFMKGWLEPLKSSFINNRSGYQLSPQVWQALGLVIHKLVNDGMTPDELFDAGIVLGNVDYSKNAKHWEYCAVMELDAKGRIYKNAASSTRLFRVGLHEYFLKLISGVINPARPESDYLRKQT